jgi:hypothetical protein
MPAESVPCELSIDVTSWVYDHAPQDMSIGDMLVILRLAWHADQHGRGAYPTLADLSEKTKLCERQVRRVLRRLEQRGLIAVQEASTRRRPTTYWFPGFAKKRGDIHDKSGGTLDASRGDIQSISTESGGTFTTMRGDIHDHEGGHSRQDYIRSEPSLTVIEPSVPPRDPPEPRTKRATAMTEEWEPSAELEKWATTELGMKYVDVNRETCKFRDHFIANGKPMKNWGAAWKNWMRRSREFSPTGASRASPVPASGPLHVATKYPQVSPEQLAEWRKQNGLA